MRMMKTISTALALLALTGSLTGCGARSNLRIGWLEAGGPGHKTARYRTFSGVEQVSFRAQAGETIELAYDVEVKKGTLVLELIDPDGETLWKHTFEEEADDIVRSNAPQQGRYTLRIEGLSTGGRFDIDWHVGEE